MNWTVRSGHLWLLGGFGFDASGQHGNLNDLWEFDPSTEEWTWMGGSSALGSIAGQPGVYGALGVPAAGNVPGGRGLASSWADDSGHFGLFGGGKFGESSTGVTQYLGWFNDLWVFQSSVGTLPATTPAFSVAAGTYTSAQSVKIADATPDATIYYTLDGSTPTNRSSQYKSALSIAKTTTVQAIAEASGYATSAKASVAYIILKPQTIDFTQPASPVVYGVKPIALSVKASSGLAVTFRVLSGPATVSGSTLTVTGAGTVVVAANQPGNATYAAAAQVTRSITVNKARLTVTANNLTMKQGATVPPLTYAMTGFVNKDTRAKATTGQPLLSTTATSKSAPGKYPITVKAGTLAAASYTFTLVNGTLTVTK